MGFDKKETDQLLADCGRRCCICGQLHRLQVHHIKPKDNGGTDDIENGIPLCPNCHDEVHTDYSSGKTTKIYSERELKLHRQRTIDLAKYGFISRRGDATSNSTKSATLASITVTPSNSSIVYGLTKQFEATGHYSDGSSEVLSTETAWTSVDVLSINSLRAYTPVPINSILLGDLSPLSQADKLAEARKQFNDFFTRAKLGDVAAIGVIQDISTIFLSLSRQYNATGAAYFTDFSAVKNALTETVSLGLDAATVAISNAPALASLRAFIHILTLSDLGALSPENKLTESRKLFTDLAKRAKLGDTEALWQLDSVSAAFLNASNYYFGGGAGYAIDFNTVQQALPEIQSLAIPVAPAVFVNNSGLATGVAIGTSIITASSGGISGTAVLTITVP